MVTHSRHPRKWFYGNISVGILGSCRIIYQFVTPSGWLFPVLNAVFGTPTRALVYTLINCTFVLSVIHLRPPIHL